jgi:hypothetical protein
MDFADKNANELRKVGCMMCYFIVNFYRNTSVYLLFLLNVLIDCSTNKYT